MHRAIKTFIRIWIFILTMCAIELILELFGLGVYDM